MKVGPVVCHSCTTPMSQEALVKYKELLKVNRTVQPCCDRITCQARAPTHAGGWITRAKPKPKKQRRKNSGQGRTPTLRRNHDSNFN